MQTAQRAKHGYTFWRGGDFPGSDASSNRRKALHLLYTNISLETKASSMNVVPTIGCTSSKVLCTMLQASAQLGPGELMVCYGPDMYMGENLVSLLDTVLTLGWSDSRIHHKIHPLHNRLTIQSLCDNVVVYSRGNCVVHHMFRMSVADAMEWEYPNAYVTAHLKVPAKMFCIALRKSPLDMGVVGSMSNILGFIERKVGEATVAVTAAALSSRDGDVNHAERAGHT
jgi:quinolinate synthase